VARVRVVGCGNPDAGDDALGLLAARAAQQILTDDVEVVEAGSGARVMDLLRNVDDVVVVDAVLGGATGGPGDPDGPDEPVIRLDASSGEVPTGVRTSLSSHGLGLADALMLAAALGPLPRIVILGLAARNTEIGSGLSRDVNEHFDALVRAIVAEVSAMRGASVP
jgi:hydrogenase maturation protease